MNENSKYYFLFCQYLQNSVPFVAYRLPGTEEICVLTGSVGKFVFSGQDEIFAQEGFLVVPFDNERREAYWLKPSRHCDSHHFSTDTDCKSVPATFDDYFSAFNKIHTAIANGEISKAVLSRRHEIHDISAETAVLCFLHLCRQKSPAYNYLLHLPEVGTWVGASPELFLKKDGQMIETVSLAGTIPTKQTNFNQKEKEEQKIVSDYVSEVLEKFSITNPVQNESIGISGNIAHLKTSFHFPQEELKGSFGKLVETLHPTPAVCGYPKIKSKQLILSTETHERNLYSGFLGKIEKDGQCALFVNIRCVQFIDNKAIVYVGGGITEKSEVQSEWQETELKLQNILTMFNLKIH